MEEVLEETLSNIEILYREGSVEQARVNLERIKTLAEQFLEDLV